MLCAVANDSKLLAAARTANDGNSIFAGVGVLLCLVRGLDFGERQLHTEMPACPQS